MYKIVRALIRMHRINQRWVYFPLMVFLRFFAAQKLQEVPEMCAELSIIARPLKPICCFLIAWSFVALGCLNDCLWLHSTDNPLRFFTAALLSLHWTLVYPYAMVLEFGVIGLSFGPTAVLFGEKNNSPRRESRTLTIFEDKGIQMTIRQTNSSMSPFSKEELKDYKDLYEQALQGDLSKSSSKFDKKEEVVIVRGKARARRGKNGPN